MGREKKLNKSYLSAALLAASMMTSGSMQAAYVPYSSDMGITASTQDYRVSGKIVDENGEPIIGANILVAGSNSGTVSDIDGNFRLNVSKFPITLKISYIGYAETTVKLTSEKPSTIVMKTEDTLLDEVIVTGYGTYKKSAYAGSASAVNSKKLKDIPAVSFQNMLQGNASGVQFTAASGVPGAATSINIRGMGSFNASNTPLYVIDGVPVMSGSIDATGSKSGLDIMSTINPSDIENISIIKDAAAASLYGSRAANGVILVTTKRGKKGKAKVNLKADWGFSDFAMDYRPVMNGAERRDYIYNGLKEGQLRKGKSEEDAIAYADKYVERYAPEPWCGFVDWDKLMFKKGNYANYEASVSGGGDKFNYYSSLAYTKQNGITKNSGLERMTGKLNVDFQATDKIKVGASMMFSKVDQDVYSEGTTYTSPFYSSRSSVVPSDYPFNEDGTWNRSFIRNKDRNPLLSMEYDYSREYVNRSFNTIYGQYEIIKDLIVKSTLSYDYLNTKGNEWRDPRTSNGDKKNGIAQKKFKEYQKLVWANQISYKFNIAKDHHFDVLAGYEVDEQKRDYLEGETTNFATSQKPALSNGVKVEGVAGSDSKSRIISYLGKLNYDFQNRYFLGASFRTDGSSRLSKDNRWGNFWSVSGAWRIGDEAFMEKASEWLTDLKLRASYGVNGTQPSDYFGYMGLSSLNGGYINQPGIHISQIENKNLQWESNYNLNVGLDFSLWNRVNTTIEFYSRTTKNLLMDCPISYTTGFGSYLMNIGKVRNTGIELEINSRNIETKDFSWNTSFNLSHNQNKILVLDGDQQEIVSGSSIHRVGKPYRTFYLVEFAGINPETGVPQFYTNDEDENGNLVKEITEDYRKAKSIAIEDKKADPSVIGGLTNTFRYKWFDFSFMLSYQLGGFGYDNWAQKTEHGGYDLKANIPTYYKDNWKKPGDIAKYEVFMEKPKQAMNKANTTRRLHSTDYLRLKSMTFGITLPKEWLQKVGVNNMRIYASANNLLTWAAYDFYDPESVQGGFTTWNTPPLKTVTFGLNVSF